MTPLVLIGAEYIHLITPIQPVKSGPHAAIRTQLGWTLQGPRKVAVQLLESQTTRVTMGRIDRHATPLICASVWASMKAPIKAAMPLERTTAGSDI